MRPATGAGTEAASWRSIVRSLRPGTIRATVAAAIKVSERNWQRTQSEAEVPKAWIWPACLRWCRHS